MSLVSSYSTLYEHKAGKGGFQAISQIYSVVKLPFSDTCKAYLENR